MKAVAIGHGARVWHSVVSLAAVAELACENEVVILAFQFGCYAAGHNVVYRPNVRGCPNYALQAEHASKREFVLEPRQVAAVIGVAGWPVNPFVPLSRIGIRI
jgi:hypothetical protein